MLVSGNRIITSLVIKLPYPSAGLLSSLFEPSSSDNSHYKSLSFINNYTACVIQAVIV